MSGDFLVTRKGPRKRAGVACLVRTTRPRLMVCDTVYRFRCDPSKVVPDYLELALNAPSTVGAIDFTTFFSITFPCSLIVISIITSP